DCFYDSIKKVEEAELLIVIGSSLAVSPVNYLAEICKRLLIINLGETFYDRKGDLIIRESTSSALERIVSFI
ncbi:MAG TPA: NAD-dependent deacetylase, partial [Bacillota bacterium]|nr:NAD-dependent deacetylase [Bacillota bacterium]